MFPIFLPATVQQLTEPESIKFAGHIQRANIAISLISQPIPTSYVCQGRGGVPVVFLHGFDSSILEFRRIIPLIAPHREVWAIDLLGFGFTERLPGCPFSATSIRNHLEAFWQTKLQQPIILVGVSMGGAAAIEFTLNNPEAVERLILIDSAGFTQTPVMSKFMIQPLSNLATNFLANPKIRKIFSEKASFDRSFVTADAQLCAALHLEMPRWNEAIIAFARSGGYGYLLDHLPKIQQKTLIIWGKHDRILGVKGAQLFKQKLPNSRLHWIDDCGHVPHLEMVQITAKYILNFIHDSDFFGGR